MKATKTKATLTRAVPVPQPPDTVTLEMPLENARALLAALWNVGGSPLTSRRGLIQDVETALGRKIGTPDTDDIDGTIMFLGDDD